VIKYVLYKNKEEFEKHLEQCCKNIIANKKEISNLVMKEDCPANKIEVKMLFYAGEVARYEIIADKYVIFENNYKEENK
jgi:hypothetical protein